MGSPSVCTPPNTWQHELLWVQSCLAQEKDCEDSKRSLPAFDSIYGNIPSWCFQHHELHIREEEPGGGWLPACCPDNTLTLCLPGPTALDWPLSSNGSPDLCCVLQANSSNTEQLEEDPAFFALRKHWGLCSPSCCCRNERISPIQNYNEQTCPPPPIHAPPLCIQGYNSSPSLSMLPNSKLLGLLHICTFYTS